MQSSPYGCAVEQGMCASVHTHAQVSCGTYKQGSVVNTVVLVNGWTQ